MNIFKKKEKPVAIVQECPAEGCTYTTTELSNMKKHIEWKHPELSQKDESAIKSIK
ncbi:MAG TPA: hypothetical protein G4O15_06400 [Dehalococcoidia bacterium]|nr:hypothetical protein [Dehalococcoidia bacterium]